MTTLIENTFEIKINLLTASADELDKEVLKASKQWINDLEKSWVLDETHTIEVVDSFIVKDRGVVIVRFAVQGEPIVQTNICKNCGKDILVSIFRGGDWCSDKCRKALGKDIK
jgi:hypothetical protein